MQHKKTGAPTNEGQTVVFKNPEPGEEHLIMHVLEMRGDRCLVESNVDMEIKPQHVYMVADLLIK